MAEEALRISPNSMEAQRDLSVALNKVARSNARVGNLVAASGLFRRWLQLREAFAKLDIHSAGSRFDVALSLHNLARLAAQQRDRATEFHYLHRASGILAAMDADGQIRGQPSRERLIDDITRRLS
jgi:hypothetical protein